ncbi:ATP-binding cassette domain-containing protein [Yinghuangia aomiensis]
MHLRPGEVLGLVGESGSGKSQTAFAILGLLPKTATVDAQDLRVTGRDLRNAPAREQHAMLGTVIGYVPQEPLSNLDPCFTIGHQLTEPMRAHLKLSRKAARDKAEALLREVGITDPAGIHGQVPASRSAAAWPSASSIAGAVSWRPPDHHRRRTHHRPRRHRASRSPRPATQLARPTQPSPS